MDGLDTRQLLNRRSNEWEVRERGEQAGAGEHMPKTVGRLTSWDIHVHSCGSDARPDTMKGMESRTIVHKNYLSSPVSWRKWNHDDTAQPTCGRGRVRRTKGNGAKVGSNVA
eukprot:2564985-Pleurochrysis_carterae.AAC.1